MYDTPSSKAEHHMSRIRFWLEASSRDKPLRIELFGT